MSGGLTEAKSLRRLTQAFRMTALCCSLGCVMATGAPPRQAFYSTARAFPKGLFLNFRTPGSDLIKGPDSTPGCLGDGPPAETSVLQNGDSAGPPASGIRGVSVAFFIGLSPESLCINYEWPTFRTAIVG